MISLLLPQRSRISLASCEHGDFVGVADVDREVVIGVHEGEEAADFIIDISRGSGSGCRRPGRSGADCGGPG